MVCQNAWNRICVDQLEWKLVFQNCQSYIQSVFRNSDRFLKMIPPYSAMHQLWRKAGRWVVGTGPCSLQSVVVSVGEFCSNIIYLSYGVSSYTTPWKLSKYILLPVSLFCVSMCKVKIKAWLVTYFDLPHSQLCNSKVVRNCNQKV